MMASIDLKMEDFRSLKQLIIQVAVQGLILPKRTLNTTNLFFCPEGVRRWQTRRITVYTRWHRMSMERGVLRAED
jgi:hypothetical protein